MPLFATRTDPVRAFLRTLRRRARIRRPLAPSLLRGTVTGALLVAGCAVWHAVAANNWHAVQPGRTYRCAQLSPAQLERALSDGQIRTIVNLRGTCTGFPWYENESRCTHAANVSQEDVCLSAIRLPSPTELRRLIEVLDRTEYPILLHCRQGVDRTGLAAVAVKLLESGVTAPAARRQLSLGFGYVPYNGTENMRRFFDLYEEWLEAVGCVHSPELFRHWATREYCPGACRGWLEPAPDFPANVALPAGQTRTFHVRAHNTSIRNWRFRPGTLQGVHARYRVVGADGVTLFQERAGLLDAVVPPGQAIDLLLGIPALQPGSYALHVDMIDVDQSAFCQFGQDPFVWDFRVAP